MTAQLYKAYGGEAANFTLVDTGSAAGLDGSIAKAYERKEGWVGYYLAPTALLGKYEMVKLDYGVPHDTAEWKRCNTVADCSDPKKNEWPKDTVQTLLTKAFSERAGAGSTVPFSALTCANTLSRSARSATSPWTTETLRPIAVFALSSSAARRPVIKT